MTKIYTLVLAFLFILNLEAQLTLTKTNNCPNIGYLESTKSYDSTIAVPKTTGANNNWNFTSLTLVPGIGTQTYVSTSSTPSAGLFPSGNLASDGGGWIEYYNSQTSKLEDLGGADATTNSKTVFSNPVTWMVWPFTFGNFNTDAFAAASTYSGNPSYNFTGNMSILGAGTGTVTLPGGAKFTNCLQIIRNYTFMVSGSLNATVTSYDYEYWTATYRSPLITISYQTVKEPTLTTKEFYVDANSFADVGIEELEKQDNSLTIYPNPVKDKLNIILPDNAIAEEIELYDLSGKLVAADKNINSVSTALLNNGVYTLIVKHKNMRLRKRIIITE